MRTALLSQLQTLQSENRRLEAELEAFGACDPIKLEQKKEAIQLAKESALRWTGEHSAFPIRESEREPPPSDIVDQFVHFREHDDFDQDGERHGNA